MRDWIAACDAFTGEPLPCLKAFGGVSPGASLPFADLERATLVDRDALVLDIPQVLSREVDLEQAQLFGRRFGAAVEILSQLPGNPARALRVGVITRTRQVLESPGPRALRVRAVADFYTSQAALLHHRAVSDGAPTVREHVEALSWSPVGGGIQHAQIHGPTRDGPVHINLLCLAGSTPLRTLDCRGQGSLTELAATHGALAAVSGGFFLYSEPDIEAPSRRGDPVGLLVDRGVLRNPPYFRRAALIQDPDRSCRLARVGMVGARIGGQRVAAMNDPTQLPAVFNRAWGMRSPEVDRPSAALVGCEVVATGRGSLPIPLAGAVFVGERPLKTGSVEISLPQMPHAAIAGGPLLHDMNLEAEHFADSAPPITFSSDETFDQNLLPRMVVGQRSSGALLFAAIDGRHFHRAPGMTLRGAWSLLHVLGCVRGLNLDGGSSKRMVVGGRTVDLATTEIVTGTDDSGPVRPVRTAILIG